ncbi:putative ethanolamine kinase [Gracilariopsis chorda]|uniref:Putative ethanolamine kinase n=1 Tax=Gracilariopsis chorda TaxID=448386 RepID=A0A2V3IJ40_9FLOR|nr:putative ethanolamine kinase [Gracilariopsis chorda]|eukprot:PXF42097.1 putative ethanolamine kinase [Gracilariopsis chorda]
MSPSTSASPARRSEATCAHKAQYNSASALANIRRSNHIIRSEADIPELLPSLLPALSRSLNIKRVPGGITNRIFKVSTATSDPLSVLVRVFGSTEVFTPEQRETENDVFAQLAHAGIAPRLLAVFGNGRVEQLLDARPIQLDEMLSDHVCVGVAKAMAQLHHFRPSGISKEARVWEDIDAWANDALRIEQKGTLPQHISVKQCIEWVKSVRIRTDKVVSPIIYAHNDLLCGNILLFENKDVRIIDFEYSSYNYRGFDIANFFSECMGGTIDGCVHPDKYPTAEYRKKFCETYLRERGMTCDQEAVSNLLNEAAEFDLLTHLYWGLWALVQSDSSTVDFPYTKFAEARFSEFCKRFRSIGQGE